MVSGIVPLVRLTIGRYVSKGELMGAQGCDDVLLRIGDGSEWTFVNGAWADGDRGLLSKIKTDGELYGDPGSYQGCHFAFYRPLCCSDLRATFTINLDGHTDTGLIFRAKSPREFYLLHFPNCGQASRAQHFWAVLSKMDQSGYLRIVKMEMLNRVPSNRGLDLPVVVTVSGNRTICRVGDYGHFEVDDDTYPGPGRVGVYLHGRSGEKPEISNVRISACDTSDAAWDDSSQPQRNWWHPVPSDVPHWQMPYNTCRFDDGQLLVLFNRQLRAKGDAGEHATATPCLAHSSDQGRTWSEPTPFAGTAGRDLAAWSGLRLHITPAGRLIAFAPDKADKFVWESEDRGQTWTVSAKMNLHLGPAREKPTQDISPNGLLNLSDGGILAPMLTRVDRPDQAKTIHTWGGGAHLQAFCMRSEDDGRSWSDPVNFDNAGADADGNPYEGNMDLTEASMVQLASGRIMAFIRPVYSPWMWETWSDDGGRNWGPCVRGPFPGYAAPNMVRTRSGAILIAHRLPLLTINCSHDEGRSWDQGTIIDSGLWAMGAMVEIEPDEVLYVYMDSYEGLMRAQHIRVTPDGLEAVR